MKQPGDKEDNDTYCELTPEAVAIIKTMPRVADEIFPYSTDAISAAFTRACYFTETNTENMPDAKRLKFHDMRHEGISRLFEMGRTIPQAASVSGHRSWPSLQRYTHLKQEGDKCAGWKWLESVTR
jgi:integrase